MTDDEIKARVLEILGDIAPEADLTNIDPHTDFREQIDIDSMDYLNFVIQLDEKFAVGVPETDYPKFTSLDSCVERLSSLQGDPEPGDPASSNGHS